jgi:multidrug efflux system membrane fusion protein
MDVEHSFTEPAVDSVAGARSPAAPPRRWRALRLLLLALFVVAAAGAAWYFWLRPAPPPSARPEGGGREAVPVAIAFVERATIPITLDALGTVTPFNTVTVRPRIAGHLTRVGFREGQVVRKGEFLAEIDPRPYEAAVKQAEGQLARNEALLRNAEIDLARYRRLVAEDSLARQQLDTQDSLVRQYRAQVKVDQAALEAARLDLSFCRIVSPIEGRVGLRLVDEGNYVQPSDTNGLVVITQIKPISVVFTIPEDELPRVAARLRSGAAMAVEAFDRSGRTLLATGRLLTIDNRIDTTTGTVRLRATFDNGDEGLFPNQFVTVRLLIETLADATLVPRAAVQRGAIGTFVFVAQPDGTAVVRQINVGTAVGDRLQVIDGLTLGEAAVVAGIDRLRDGAKVRVLEPLSSAPQPDPGSAKGDAGAADGKPPPAGGAPPASRARGSGG